MPSFGGLAGSGTPVVASLEAAPARLDHAAVNVDAIAWLQAPLFLISDSPGFQTYSDAAVFCKTAHTSWLHSLAAAFW